MRLLWQRSDQGGSRTVSSEVVSPLSGVGGNPACESGHVLKNALGMHHGTALHVFPRVPSLTLGGCRIPVFTQVLCPQRLQQRLRLLQVGGVKALSEPAIDRRQQLVGSTVLALLLPEAAQTHRSAEFEGFGLLMPSIREGPQRTLVWCSHSCLVLRSVRRRPFNDWMRAAETVCTTLVHAGSVM